MPCAAKMTLGEWSGEDTAAIDVVGVVNHSLEPWDSIVEPLELRLGDLRKDFTRCHSLFVLVVYFKYYILQEECALSRCIEVLYYKGLDVEARSGEPPSVLTLFDRVFVHENLTCEEQVLARSLHQSVPIVHAIVLGSTTLGPVSPLSILSSSGGSSQC